MEETPEFLPSENEDSDEDMDDTTDSASGLPTYVPPHLPTFPSKHSFRQTPVNNKPSVYISSLFH